MAKNKDRQTANTHATKLLLLHGWRELIESAIDPPTMQKSGNSVG
jgi:hypothetical protein